MEESRSDLLGDFQNLDEVTVRYSICKSGHDDNGDGDVMVMVMVLVDLNLSSCSPPASLTS